MLFRSFSLHPGHWWCQEGHLITNIAPWLQLQNIPKSHLEKSQIILIHFLLRFLDDFVDEVGRPIGCGGFGCCV